MLIVPTLQRAFSKESTAKYTIRRTLNRCIPYLVYQCTFAPPYFYFKHQQLVLVKSAIKCQSDKALRTERLKTVTVNKKHQHVKEAP